jgi:hypothetical protein
MAVVKVLCVKNRQIVHPRVLFSHSRSLTRLRCCRLSSAKLMDNEAHCRSHWYRKQHPTRAGEMKNPHGLTLFEMQHGT